MFFISAIFFSQIPIQYLNTNMNMKNVDVNGFSFWIYPEIFNLKQTELKKKTAKLCNKIKTMEKRKKLRMK